MGAGAAVNGRFGPSSRWLGVLLSIGLLAAANGASAQNEALDPAALAIMRRMADQLRSLPAFRVEAQIEYDALQRDGQTIEFGSTREMAVRRPDRLRATAIDRSGAQRSLYYDGKQVVVFDHEHSAYAVAEKTGNLDEVVRFAETQLGIPVPLGDLLAIDLGQQLDEDLVFAAVVGTETIDGIACDHLALRNADRGIQIWVQQGKTPLPRRISITWEQAPGRPQFRARLTKWELSPRLSDAFFVFEPPKGAERIRFLQPPAAAPTAAGGR